MTEKFISALELIYGSSATPAAAADGNMNVLWRNRAAEADGCPLKEENISRFFRGSLPEEGVNLCESPHSFNVRKAEDGGGTLYVIEYAERYGAGGQLDDPDVKDYLTYLCARIRETAGMIAVSADEIDSLSALFGSAGGEITDCLNTIDRGLMLILREVVMPEQFYYVLDPFCTDTLINAGDELEKAAEDAGCSFGDETKVSSKTEKNICICMNRSVFEAIAADMTAECCCGELFPDEVVYSCGKTADGKAEISVRSINRSGRKNIPSKFDAAKKESRIYADNFRRAVCRKYGAEFYSESFEDGYLCRMEIPADKSGRQIVMTDRRFSVSSQRFCAAALVLAERHHGKRYRYIDIDETDT